MHVNRSEILAVLLVLSLLATCVSQLFVDDAANMANVAREALAVDSRAATHRDGKDDSRVPTFPGAKSAYASSARTGLE